MSDTAVSRAANRPSRRHEIIRAAIGLGVVQPWELVTISSIVQDAGMTPAAFYYHFSSRDQLLEEIVRSFADDWVARGESLWSEASSHEEIIAVVLALLDWVAEDRQPAMMYFVTTAGASLAIEDIRREARDKLSQAATAALRRLSGSRQSAKQAVHGLALVVISEIAARAQLSLDQSYRTLGPRRFREEVTELCHRTLGL